MQNLFRSACPEVRRTTETFTEWSTIGGERRRFEFNREIVWLQESEAVVRFVHGGEELKHGSTHNDFYGYLTSAECVVEDAHRATKAYGVTADSTLVVEIVVRVYQSPVIETEEARAYNRTKPNNHKSKWAYLPDDWRKEVQVDGETVWPRLERVELAEEVVWSSKESMEENQALLSEFRRRWSVSRVAEIAVAL